MLLLIIVHGRCILHNSTLSNTTLYHIFLPCFLNITSAIITHGRCILHNSTICCGILWNCIFIVVLYGCSSKFHNCGTLWNEPFFCKTALILVGVLRAVFTFLIVLLLSCLTFWYWEVLKVSCFSIPCPKMKVVRYILFEIYYALLKTQDYSLFVYLQKTTIFRLDESNSCGTLSHYLSSVIVLIQIPCNQIVCSLPFS